MTLYDKLQSLSKSDMLPLHMPGHKRSHYISNMSDIYDIDITEIDGFDDLHHPTGILADMAKQAAGIYGAVKAFISVGGSSAANQAAIMTAVNGSEEVLIDRGCHKSVYYAIELGNLYSHYLKPVYDHSYKYAYPVRKEEIARALEENPQCKTVVITSPTYEGFIADVTEIAETVHSYGGTLIVDAAHGAHLGFGDECLANPVNQGADIVVMSLHKMLPAPTQTALLLVGSNRVDTELLQHYLSVFQSSSPSYVLMAGIGECLKFMENDGRSMYTAGLEHLKSFRRELADLKNISVDVRAESPKKIFDADPYKVIIASDNPGVSGKDIYTRLLDKYHIQCEMYAERYALAMFSLMDNEESYDRLGKALREIDTEISGCGAEKEREYDICDENYDLKFPDMQCTPGKAIRQASENCSLNDDCIGRISADYVMAYPPGVPIIVPGEVYSPEIIEFVNKGLRNGLNIIGINDDMEVRVVK